MLALLLLACAPDEETGPPTWHADVSPALTSHCVRCHSADGQGPGDFTDYAQVVDWQPYMIDAIDRGDMAPPVSDPECRDYVGSEHLVNDPTLSATLAAWAEAGFPEGDPADAPDVTPIETSIADPDLEIFLPAPYTPTFSDPDNPGNEYRCFAIEHGQSETFYVKRMAPIIDQTPIVHHALLFTVQDEDIPEHDPEAGWDCIDDAFIGGSSVGAVLSGNGMVGAWAPGMLPIGFEGDAGLRVTPDMKMVIQLHYYDAGPETRGLPDQSGWAFETTDEVDRPILIAPLGIFNFRIPAGVEAYTDTRTYQLPIPLRVYGMFPHMHVLGTRYEVTVDGDAGERCAARGDYDFDNQIGYIFREPLDIESNDLVSISCTWNNSTSNPDRIHDEPEDVRYGERTDEEMCYAFSMVSLGD
ncbi:MAG: hypothetical protein H6739_16375 [Alphaproteobacteria bacterium]|nr:hypothetical protein [Alphaproteobacteria bacterium]